LLASGHYGKTNRIVFSMMMEEDDGGGGREAPVDPELNSFLALVLDWEGLGEGDEPAGEISLDQRLELFGTRRRIAAFEEKKATVGILSDLYLGRVEVVELKWGSFKFAIPREIQNWSARPI
jgi:hypothetical protein